MRCLLYSKVSPGVRLTLKKIVALVVTLTVLLLFNKTSDFGNITVSHPESTNVSSWRRMDSKRACTIISANNTAVDLSMEQLSMQELENKFKYLELGGHYIPKHCSGAHRVAIIIPYRNRPMHLPILLNNFHPFLTEQELDYSIFVVEQISNQTFNRGKLLNIGFVEAMKIYDWQCVLLHDVDLLPEDKRNLHVCPQNNPRHMAVAMDKYNYSLHYDGMFGTSSLLNVKQYRDVNGLSNQYWGWGKEDDDLFRRIMIAGYEVERYDSTIARYTMIKHQIDDGNPMNPCREKLFEYTRQQWRKDGLNSLRYKLINITFTQVYTRILVDLLEEKEKPIIYETFCAEEGVEK
ncbi:unnamed protein product [Cylicocyclus nassatus]|uniref:Beta-1,4-N-acetylgalactosaminyltransferase n=1 Tax=Cylicocyclus nassatus TaxID=53992 RepID=A0AA36DL72_CYLNA|nr:unnamed protein product [Cylicocyclus nassatus]